MARSEMPHIIIAIIVLALVISFEHISPLNLEKIALGFLFAMVIILSNVLGKKVIANTLDADVKHEILQWSRYGLRPGSHLKNALPAGIIIPIIFTAISLGFLKIMTILSYETTALKRRAARRFGHYSFTEMTEWHNALVGAAGIAAVLLISLISYFIPFLEGLPRLAALYAFINLFPIFKLDGTHIFFGSRVLWTILAIISTIFVAFAYLTV
jgi:hypothetical protein